MRRSRLRRVSPRYSEALNEYYTRTKPLQLEAHPYCQFEVCLGTECGVYWGLDVHHKKGRKKFLNDPDTLMTVCRRHHNWIEANKREARNRGYILYP